MKQERERGLSEGNEIKVHQRSIRTVLYVIAINVYVARDVMILMQAISITRAIGRGGP